MPSYNRITLIGHLGKDPEQKESKSGKPMCTFSLATSDGYGDRKETNWHNIVVFGKLVEICMEYLKKGSLVLVAGRVSYFTKEKEGVKQTYTSVIVDEMQMLDRQNKGESKKDNDEPF
jgi:single-strand DNA-binding protein